MDNFLKVLEEAKAAELKELIKTLKKKKETVIAQLESEVVSLEKQLNSQKESNKHLEDQQKKYREIRINDFIELQVKKEIAEKEFNKIASNLLKTAKFEKDWLTTGVDELKDFDKGTIIAGESAKILKDIKTKHTLKSDKDFKQKGFIFSNDNVEVDYSEDTFFKNIFEENRSEIYKTLFK